MNIPIKVTENTKILAIIKILQCVAPFSNLRPKQVEVFAELCKEYNKFISEGIDSNKANKLLLDYDTYIRIADNLNTKIANIYNIMSELRKDGLLLKDCINPKYLIKDFKEISFTFINS